MKHRRHVPMRTCIGCRQKRAKRELLRVARKPAGSLEVDARGKCPGRGAYVCPNHACLQKALEQGRLQRALKCQVSEEDVASLKEAVGSLLDGDVQAESDVLLPEVEAVHGQAE